MITNPLPNSYHHFQKNLKIMMTVLLISNHDYSEHVGSLTFTNRETAHNYLAQEFPDTNYCFLHEEQFVFKTAPFITF